MHLGGKSILLFGLLSFLIISRAEAQSNDDNNPYRIAYITSDNGLSQNTVDCILKDSRGFMWFGTWNGLNRFDGYSFKIYKREDQQYSLTNNFIHSVCEDVRGNLWIGTRNGLNLLQFETDKITGFYHDSVDEGSLAGNWINEVYCDRDGVVWVGTNGGGMDRIYHDSLGKGYYFRHFRSSLNSPIRISGNIVNSIFSDSKRRLWIGTATGLTLYYKNSDSTVIFQNSSDPGSLSGSEIRCAFEDKGGSIWIGTQYGLNRWIEGTDHFIRYLNEVDDPASLSHSTINAIGEDPEGHLYIATLGGVDIFDPAINGFDHLPVYGDENLSLNNEFINSLWCDKTGLVWIGTEKGGINRFNIYQKQFHYLSADSKEGLKLNHNTVNSILEEGKVLWVGTAGGGLNLVDRSRNLVRYLTYDPRRGNSLSNDFVTSLCRDRNGNLWIGTWGGGFSKLISTADEGKFMYFQNQPGNEGSLIDNFVSTIYEDRTGKLWIGTEGGLDLFDPGGNSFTHIMNRPVSGRSVTDIGCLLRDRDGDLWIGTRNGLYLIGNEDIEGIEGRPNDINVKIFRYDPEDINSISENYVISLFEDSQGTLWIGTYGNGLNELVRDIDNSGKVIFRHYRQKDGLSNNVVYGILGDQHHNLWLSTDYGLSKFNTEEKSFNNYFVDDGLRSNQFYWSACASGSDGILYFGGMKGLNYFLPENIVNNMIPPRPVLTDFKILNNQILPGKSYGNRIILNKLISETDEITLNYRENTFSLEFSSLSFHLPEKNKYEYKLEGVDEEWIQVSSNRRFASYTKLPGGEYTFLLRASNNDGLWSDPPQSLRIIVRPPFWKTTWFRILLFCAAVVVIVVYFRLHTRSLKLQKRKLEQLVKERTAQIEDQKIRLEEQNAEILDQRDKLIQMNKKVKAANQQKLKFFTNISHEFRTPLTLILGPLEKLRNSWKAEDETKQLLNLITRNAERLLHLINQLMDFRKIEKGKMALHVQEGNLDEFINKILEAFRDLINQKKIRLEYDSDKIQDPIWFDHEKLENVLYNLLSNAFKYTPDYGTVNIRVRFTDQLKLEGHHDETRKNGKLKYVQIGIADTGIGIKKEKLPNIFKRFYQADEKSDGTMGSGIGLSLTRDLVKIHRGHIEVESEVGKGTRFTIHLPCDRKAFSEEEITEAKFGATSLKGHVEMLKDILASDRKKENEQTSLKLVKHMGKPTLLIVEDNSELKEFIARRLNHEFNILMAENGEVGFDLAIAHNPDLIISDIMMPVLDGLELCRLLKQKIDTSHIPVIMLTAKDSVENKIEGFKTGADDYIPKPFNIELLETRVKNLIESRTRLRKIFASRSNLVPEELTENPMDQKFIRDALEHIERNIDNTEFNVNDFAAVMCVSRSLLHKKLTALTDQSATDFINTVRLKKSRELILSGVYNISEVAYAVGYNDPKYFSRLFKKQFGIAPSEFLREIRSKAV